MSTAAVVTADGLMKRFGEVEAVVRVSFEVAAGEVLGLLGPNGVGKATLVKMVTTLLSIDSGSARVGGFAFSWLGAAIAAKVRQPDMVGMLSTGAWTIGFLAIFAPLSTRLYTRES